jgi:hypothetical protein
MEMLPCFVFPPAKDSEVFDPTFTAKKERPHIQLDTNTETGEEYRLAVPGREYSRPANLRTVPTPPGSPTHMRSSSLGSHEATNMHDSGALTPPVTPTSSPQTKRNSSSSDHLTLLSCLRRGDSMLSLDGRPSLDDVRPGSTELLTYPHHSTDYTIRVDEKGRKKPIGVGAWSDVYLATPSLPQPTDRPNAPMSPPITPIHSHDSSLRKCDRLSIPESYAIKVPGSTSAKKVLDAEARILSYLSRFPDADTHVIPFFGQDTRTGSLVLQAKDGTLEDWIQTHLNTLDEPSRATHLASIFPSLALSLIDSLLWMHDKDCIHADIKPSNILYSSSSTSPLHLVFSDFSSTLLTILTSNSNDDTSTPPPMGAGTWEFLDPSLLSSFNPATPCAATDLWSLGITLLFVILGTSPYEAFKVNKFQQREMIKSGCPLQCLAYDDLGVVNVRRLNGLSKALGWDVGRWFGKVLVKSKEKRVGLRGWREELVRLVERGTARM